MKHYSMLLRNAGITSSITAVIRDESRADCQISVVMSENIRVVREVILQNCHVTYREIEVSVGTRMLSINKILNEHLAVNKIVLHNLTQY